MVPLPAFQKITSDLPTGTVTFLFTDIEGSTNLAQQYPEALPALLTRHNTILREAIELNHGQVFRIIGDAFCAAFPTPSDALKAALMAQRALQHEPWNPAPVRVRMGVHTGEAQTALRENQLDPYVGYLTLTLAQRIMSTAQGGQILLANTSAELVRGELPTNISLRDMGEHKLKGLLHAVRLWQVIAPDLQQDFAPLQSLNTIPNNLPIQVTSFVGREKEVAEVKNLLTSGPSLPDSTGTVVRLLTLTGSGGCGKTRLSLQVAGDVLETFNDGVWFVELAPLADPAFVPQAVASALGLQEQAGRRWVDTLSDHLRAKHLLLVLDNCEHLIEACAQLADQLLHNCPKLHILASSREALGIAGETAYRVPSLSLPDPRQFVGAGQQERLPLESLMEYEAVRLFIERAVAVQPSFAMSNQNAPAIAQICQRLDGIPLALELAAARIKLLKVEQIAARLDDRFRLLTGGGRTAMPRHQTLRAAIDWSYELLAEPERVLLRRLAVFAGGWTLEAAETVTTAPPAVNRNQSKLNTDSNVLATDVLDLLAHLADRSMIVVDDSGEEARYHLLETIRQYAREKLLESGEAEEVRDQHLEFFVTVAEKAEPKLYGAEPAKWLGQLDTEHDNLRAAIEWAIEGGRVELGLRLAVALSWFWFMRVYYTEGQERIGALIARSGTVEKSPQLTLALAKAQNRAADFALDLGDLENARSFSETSLSLASREEDKKEIAHALDNLARLAMAKGDLPKAATLFDQSIARYREAKDNRGLGGALQGLAVALTRQGNIEQGVSLYEQVIALRREMDDKTLLAFALDQLGRVLQLAGNLERAAELHKESLQLRMRVDNRRGIAFSFLSFASLAAAQKKVERAVRLYGAGDALLKALRAQEKFRDPLVYVQDVATLRVQLDEASFNALWNEGRAMTTEQAIQLALEETCGG